MAHVKRTLEIHFDSEKLVFDQSKHPQSKEQYEAFLKALGYMLFYGMSGATLDSKVNGGINVGKSGMDDVEICLTYRDADAAPETRGFTMAAVSRDGGVKYTTHS
jgi:hypothetical protein